MRTVTVVGQGSARAVPDTAVLSVAAVHRAGALTDALTGAESAREAVVTATAAVPGAVVGSVDLHVWPAQDDRGRDSGFEARHSLSIRVADLDEAGVLVGALARDVGDRLVVSGVSLVVGDPSAALVTAREAAFADARARAEHLATLAGAVLGEVQAVSEGSSIPGGGMVAFSRSAKGGAGFAPGETSIDQALTVTFQLT